MRFTKELRQKIVDDFSRKHNGILNPAVFLAEVKAAGASHLAYSWYQWDDTIAAHEYRLWQTRILVQDLKVRFEVENVGRSGTITVRETSMPMLLSPLSGRRDGGAYIVSNPSNAEHMAELCRQASNGLHAWLDRYEAALLHIGAGPASIEKIAKALDAVNASEEAEAA